MVDLPAPMGPVKNKLPDIFMSGRYARYQVGWQVASASGMLVLYQD
jgi:hypothetical protein